MRSRSLRRFLQAFAVAVVGVLIAASVSATAAEVQPLEIVTKSGVHVFSVEIAKTEQERATGLMYRKELAEGRGMLFDFTPEQQVSMWMKNTFIPLDMIFVTSEGVVDSFVENAEPRTDAPRPSDGAARYVIELNAGEVARMGLEPGSSVTLTGLPPEHSP